MKIRLRDNKDGSVVRFKESEDEKAAAELDIMTGTIVTVEAVTAGPDCVAKGPKGCEEKNMFFTPDSSFCRRSGKERPEARDLRLALEKRAGSDLEAAIPKADNAPMMSRNLVAAKALLAELKAELAEFL